MRTHCVIPDTQVRSGVPLIHLDWISRYITEKRPDVLIHLGDHWDMPSLSSYASPLEAEGRRYIEDIKIGNLGFAMLNRRIEDHNKKKRKNKEKQYHPEKHFLFGNHEHRVTRYLNEHPKMDGFISLDHCKTRGWERHDFKTIIEIDGVHYSHYFYNPSTGRPYGGMMETRLKNVGFPFVQGHQQGLKTGMRELGNGAIHRGIVAGSCYLHEEDYRGPQAAFEWRGILMLFEVEKGNYSLQEVSLDFLSRKYTGKRAIEHMP